MTPSFPHILQPPAFLPDTHQISQTPQSPVNMEEKLKELEDEIHLDIEDKEDKKDNYSSDEKKHL